MHTETGMRQHASGMVQLQPIVLSVPTESTALTHEVGVNKSIQLRVKIVIICNSYNTQLLPLVKPQHRASTRCRTPKNRTNF